MARIEALTEREVFLVASSSEINLVAAKLMPEFATVTEKTYTLIIREYRPVPEAPILFEIYALKETPAVCITKEVNDKMRAFIKNLFLVFKGITSFYFIKKMS